MINTNTSRLHTLRDDLHGRYGHVLETATIDRTVDRIIDEHTQRAVLDDFLAVLVARDAEEQLASLAGRPPRQRVYFVAGSNPALAEVAAAMTRSLSGHAIAADTVGSHPENTVDDKIADVVRQRGYHLARKHDSAVASRTIHAPEFIVYLSDNDCDIYGSRRQAVWDMPHTAAMNDEEIREVTDDLAARIHALMVELGVPVVLDDTTLVA